MFKIKTYITFYLFLLFVISYVGLLTFLRPLTMDDFFYANAASSGGFAGIFKFYFKHYISWGPRIGTLFDMLFLAAGKGLFVFINVIVQVLLIFCMHYTVTGKKINPSEKKDVFLFMILAFLLLFNATGGQTLFWISGVSNYSFPALILFTIIVFLRALINNKNIIGNGVFVCVFVCILGFIIGMSNENVAPIALISFSALFVYMKIKKNNIPKWFYFLLAGTFAGTICLFAAPGSYKRMNYVNDFSMTDIFSKLRLQESANDFLNASLFHKIKFIPLRIGKFLVLSAGLPVVITVFLFIAVLKNNAENKLNKNIYPAAVFLLASFVMVCLLCFAPKPSIRAYFVPLLTLFVSFAFVLVYITDNFSKKTVVFVILILFSAGAAAASLKIVPSFYYLYMINAENLKIIKESLKTPYKHAEIYKYDDIPLKQYHAILSPGANKDFHINIEMAKYYGLNSIVAKKQ